MGCVSSKKKLCKNCQAPVRRSYSMHLRRPPDKAANSHHVVALTSSTLGSLRLDPPNQNHPINQNHFGKDDTRVENEGISNPKVIKDEFKMEMIEAKSWSKMIDEKIPKVFAKTPTRTPPGEPEIINVWELMEGLEDTAPLKLPHHHHHIRSFSFQVLRNPHSSNLDEQTMPRVKDDTEASLSPDITHDDNPVLSPRVKENEEASFTPLCQDTSDNDSNSNDTSIVSEFDPEMIATFRKALEELPPANPFHLKSLDSEKQASLPRKDPFLPCRTDKLILYYTSLRGVRKTYEDCCHVRVILKGLGVKIDEKDVSMHSGFKEELKELLGDGVGGCLPRVFVGRKYIGGAEEIRRMNDEGELAKVVQSCELVEDDGGGGRIGGACEACGDVRFVPCETCCGSCKIYYEADSAEECDETEREYGFHRCPDCNENGLVRCPICCD